MGHSILLSQPADGNPYHYWLGSDGTREGREVIVPWILPDPESGAPPDGINISNIYTWVQYPPGRIGPAGGVISECDVTISAAPSTHLVSFVFVFQKLQF